MAEQLLPVGQYLQTAKRKVTTGLTYLKEWREKMRDPLSANSLDEFMGLVDVRDGAVVELYPWARGEGYHYQREKRSHEYVGGFEPTWVTEFKITGWTFLTAWEARTPSKRLVVFRDEHEKMELNRMDAPRGDRYDEFRNKWFAVTLQRAQEQHQRHPQMKFMVAGADGLQEYSNYLGWNSWSNFSYSY